MRQQTQEGILYLPDRYCCMQYNKLTMGQPRITNRIGITGSVRGSKLSLYRPECGGGLYTAWYPIATVDGRTVDPRIGVSYGDG